MRFTKKEKHCLPLLVCPNLTETQANESLSSGLLSMPGAAQIWEDCRGHYHQDRGGMEVGTERELPIG